MLSNLSIVIKQQSRKLKSAAHFKKNFVKTFARIVDKMIIGFLEKNECSATFTEHFLYVSSPRSPGNPEIKQGQGPPQCTRINNLPELKKKGQESSKKIK